MDLMQVAAALASAMLHAGWNAAVKSSPQPTQIMTAQMVISAAIVVPGLLWTGLPAQAAWGWIAASTSVNLLIIIALLRAYEVSGFGMAYPVARALSVLLVAPLATILSGEALSPYGLIGIALVAASLLLLALGRAGPGALPRAALGWIVVAGMATATCVMCDAQGVRRAGAPWAYGFMVSIANGIAMFCGQATATGVWRISLRHAATALPIAVAAVVSYLLILWVWSHGPIAPGAALRDTSAIFAVIIAIAWLKEPFTRLRLIAIALAGAAVPLLRLA